MESYTQAIDKFETEVELAALRDIRSAHQDAASRLREHLIEMGGEPSADSGAWGGFVKALEGTAKLLGESPALAVLEQGEQHGIKEYKEALENPDVMEDVKQVIRGELLPAQAEHLATLGRLRNH